ncbi:hypothetical protein KP509_05G077900 [Ceratopteris richardii]|uniref:VPS37 C-terminal domain-containing protein n=1 Tax=Ceratopteris richardii TaxID=49495 RepID=A0A8T2USE3_CERRI|nr:hypothetical protein KP509_05G077900 [Ceratopteris richardii]
MYGNYSNGYFNAHPWFTPQPQPQPHTTGVNAPTSQNNGSRPFPPQQPVTSSSTSSSSDIVQALNDKSTEELQRLLLDDDAYNTFLQNSDAVRQIDSLWKEMSNRNVELAKQNLEKESEIFQLKNQCTVIRTTELAAAQERFNEACKKQADLRARFSPGVLIERLQEAAVKIDNDSEDLFNQLLSGGMEINEFLKRYRELRFVYHKRTLTRLAAKSSGLTPGC